MIESAVQCPEVEHAEVEEEEEPLVPADAEYKGCTHDGQCFYHVHLRPSFGRVYLSVLSLTVDRTARWRHLKNAMRPTPSKTDGFRVGWYIMLT